MTAQLKLSNILLAAALGATSTVYASDTPATEQNNKIDHVSTASSAEVNIRTQQSGMTSNNSTTISNNSSFSSRPSGYKVIQQSPTLYKKGFFTDTFVSSRIIELEEFEFTYPVAVAKISSGTVPVTDVSNKASREAFSVATKKINTYLEVELCEGNAFYGKCESFRTPIEPKPSAADGLAPKAP